MNKFRDFSEAKKKTKEPNAPTPTSSPTRGANQDYTGVGVKHDVADYTISDEKVPDSWEDNTPGQRIATVKKLIKQDERHGAVHMPHNKIKEETIDEVVAGVGSTRITPVNMGHQTGKEKNKNAPSNVYKMQAAADQRAKQLDQAAQKAKEQQTKDREQQQADREKSAMQRQKQSEKKPFASFKEHVELDEAQIGAGRRGRPKKNTSDEDPGSDNIITQLRKVISLRGQEPVKFVNGQKVRLSPGTAHTLLARYDNLRTTGEKHAMSIRMHKSPESLRDVLMGKAEPKKPKISLAGKITGTQQ